MMFVALFYYRPAAAAIDDKWLEPQFVEEARELLMHNDDGRHLPIKIDLSRGAGGRTVLLVGIVIAGASF